MSIQKSQNTRRRDHRASRQEGDFDLYLQPIFLTTILYPLKRIQTNFQIKATYTKQQIRQCKQFITRCTHYGIRSLFRGLTAYLIKITVPYMLYHGSESLADFINITNANINKQTLTQIVQYLALATGYTIIYPFENVRVRMGGDIERDRAYKNVRDCLTKMRKVQGKSSYFKGFCLSLPYFLLQYGAAINLYKYLVAQQKEQTFSQFLKKSTGFSLFMISYLSTELLLHPIDSIRKIVQINGSLNHDNVSTRYRDVFKFHKLTHFYRGIGTKITNGLLYSLIMLGLQKKPTLY